MRERDITVDSHDACVIKYSLECQCARVKDELAALKISKDRELSQFEREYLPPNIADYSRDELKEQIDPWISLLHHYESLIERFNFEI